MKPMVATDLWKASVAQHKMLESIGKNNHAGWGCNTNHLIDSAEAINNARTLLLVIDPTLRAELADVFPEPENS